MPPKAAVTTLLTVVITSKTGRDTSIADTNLELVTRGQLQEIVDQLIDNNAILKERLNGIGIVKIKLSLIKWFIGEKLRLKGFLTQIYFKVL